MSTYYRSVRSTHANWLLSSGSLRFPTVVIHSTSFQASPASQGLDRLCTGLHQPSGICTSSTPRTEAPSRHLERLESSSWSATFTHLSDCSLTRYSLVPYSAQNTQAKHLQFSYGHAPSTTTSMHAWHGCRSAVGHSHTPQIPNATTQGLN